MARPVGPGTATVLIRYNLFSEMIFVKQIKVKSARERRNVFYEQISRNTKRERRFPPYNI
jgi:hypothetical protein